MTSSIVVSLISILLKVRDFLGVPVVKELPCNAGIACSIPRRGNKTPYAS